MPDHRRLTMMFARLALLAVFTLVAAPLSAQRPAATPAPRRATPQPAPRQQPAQAAGSPRVVAQRVLNALSARDAVAFARDVHPQEMVTFRNGLLPMIRQAAAANKQADVVRFFPGTKSVGEIEKLSVERFFVGYLQGVFQRMEAAGNVRLTNTVLGDVAEGDSLSHIVYRARITQGPNERVDMAVLTLKRSPGGWKIFLPGDFTAMGRAGGQ